MTITEAQQAAGTRFLPITPRGECFLAIPENAPNGITFWIVESTIERVDINTSVITTRSGAGVGKSEEQILNMFGERIEIQQLPNRTGNLLIYVPQDKSDRKFRVVFESDGEKIIRFWSGRLPWTEWLEKCKSKDQ
tara:strand:- start:2452 stop:2859 length:408 start_codon:yes stop_codon:yes gene_type:complete